MNLFYNLQVMCHLKSLKHLIYFHIFYLISYMVNRVKVRPPFDVTAVWHSETNRKSPFWPSYLLSSLFFSGAYLIKSYLSYILCFSADVLWETGDTTTTSGTLSNIMVFTLRLVVFLKFYLITSVLPYWEKHLSLRKYVRCSGQNVSHIEFIHLSFCGLN